MNTRQLKKSDFSVFSTTAELLKISHSELCIRLGYADHTFHGWRNTNSIPHVVVVACEGLLAMAGKEGPQRAVFVAYPPTDKVELLSSMLDAMKINWTKLD